MNGLVFLALGLPSPAAEGTDITAIESRTTYSSQGSLSTVFGCQNEESQIRGRILADASGLVASGGFEAGGGGLALVTGPVEVSGALAFLNNPLSGGQISIRSSELGLDRSLVSAVAGLGIFSRHWGLFAFGRGDGAGLMAKKEGPLPAKLPSEASAAFAGLRGRMAFGDFTVGTVAGIGYLKEKSAEAVWQPLSSPTGPWFDPAFALFLKKEGRMPRVSLALGLSDHGFFGPGIALRLESASSYRNLVIQGSAMASSPSFRGWAADFPPSLGRAELDASLGLSWALLGLRTALVAQLPDRLGIPWFESSWRIGIKGGSATRPGPLRHLQLEARVARGAEHLAAALELGGAGLLANSSFGVDIGLDWESCLDSAFLWSLESGNLVSPSGGRVSASLVLARFSLGPSLLLSLDCSGSLDLAGLAVGGALPRSEASSKARASADFPGGFALSLALSGTGAGTPGMELSLVRRWPPPDDGSLPSRR